jgi:hypothetical protein
MRMDEYLPQGPLGSSSETVYFVSRCCRRMCLKQRWHDESKTLNRIVECSRTCKRGSALSSTIVAANCSAVTLKSSVIILSYMMTSQAEIAPDSMSEIFRYAFRGRA